MKIKKILFIASIAAISISLTSCNIFKKQNNYDSTLVTKVHTIKRVPIYTTLEENSQPIDHFNIHHFNNSSVGYFDLKDIFKVLKAGALKNYNLTQEDKKFTISNGLGSALIDFDAQTIAYKNYDGYACIDSNYIPYQDIFLYSAEAYFIKDKTESYYDGIDNDLVIDLKKYNIPLYFDEGNGYLPIDIVGKFLAPLSNLALTYNGTLVFVGNFTSFDQKNIVANTATIYDQEYMEYTYNLLALNLDNLLGLDQRHSSIDGHLIDYHFDNIYDILKPYHDDLVSTDPNISNSAIMQVISDNFDDGGHTGYATINVFSESDFADEKYYHTPAQTQKLFNLSNKMSEVRKAAGYDPSDVVSAQLGVETTANHCYQEIDGVAYVTFDEFTGNGTPTNVPVTLANYWSNTLYLIHFANEQIRAHNIKKVVIDISKNSGGSVCAENFVGSWICNGVTTKTRNNKQKSYSVQTNYADVDFNGIYDENDYLPSNVDVTCIISNVCFSSGNLLPYQLSEQSNVRFIGETTGGGSCMVTSLIPSGLGAYYQCSSVYQFGSIKSTSYDHFITVEDGVSPDLAKFSSSDETIKNFYNRTYINSLIK